MSQALRAQESGNLVLAERLYRESLARLPDEPDCLHMLGVVCLQAGRYREAAELVQRALKVTDGRFPVMRQNLSLVASHLMDEPLFWPRDGEPTIEALFALPPAVRTAYDARNSAARPGVRVLIIDRGMPRRDRDSGSARMAAMLALWKEASRSVAFTSMAEDYDPGRDAWLSAMGVDVLSGPGLWAGPTQVLAAIGAQLDIVVASRIDVALPCEALVRHFAPQALFVFDTVDLHFLRMEREARATGDPRVAARAAIVRQQELGVVRTADLTLVVSDAEQALLRGEAPDAPVDVLSNVHEVLDRPRGFERRSDVFFVGGFSHAPNVDAVRWYAAEVWPRVRRRLPGLRTFIVGSDIPASVADLASDGIVVVGHAPDLRPWLEGCRVAIAPLRYGAGVKGKVSQALSAGVPVVATTIAAEGMHLEHGRSVLIGDTADAFADAVVRLHEDAKAWAQISERGLTAARRHFSPDAARQAIKRVRDLAQSRTPGPARAGPTGRRRALVLVPASYGSLGDEAMVRGLVSSIDARARNWEIDLVSIYGGERWPALPGIGRVIHLNPAAGCPGEESGRRFEAMMRRYEAVAVLGADVLDGHYSIDESMQRLALARAASAQGCATAVLGFSVNDHPAAETLAGLAAVAQRAPLCVRDPVSWRRLHERGIANLVLAADPAFLMRPAAASAATVSSDDWIRSERASGRRVVMLNVSAQSMAGLRLPGADRSGDLIELACDLIVRRGASILWCPHDLRQPLAAGDSDCELAADGSRRVALRLAGDRHQFVAPPMGADEIKHVAGMIDMVISPRMHLAIAALGMGKPAIGIAYQGKFEGLWEHFGLRRSLFDAWSPVGSGLHEACVETLARLDELSAEVAARVPAVVALARGQVDLWLEGTRRIRG